MKYRNFDLKAFDYSKDVENVERFRVMVERSPAGEQHQFEAETVSLSSELRGRLRQLENRRLTLSEMIGIGEGLAAALFPPQVRTFLDRSRERVGADDGLRIRLKLDTYALADLPWEYVYVPRPGTPPNQKGPDGFLVLDRSISLVRYEILGQTPGTLDPVSSGPLRLVALLSSPDAPGLAQLDLKTEQENIAEALKGLSSIRAEFYRDATIERMLDVLIQGAHVFHFAGHGKFEGDLGNSYGSIEGKGYLLLVNATGGEEPLSADKLALNLRGRGLRLAVLGACEGGRRDQVNAWTGIVPSLTKVGIPAVVGMQYTVRDASAIAFSRQFYRALVAGQPIDAAMTDGRLAILDKSDENERDWGVPVLYLRAEEGILFPQRPLDDVASATTGIRLLEEMIAKVPTVAEAVSRSREVIENTYRQVHKLRLFKKIHDGLHTIEFECLRIMQAGGPTTRLRPFQYKFAQEAKQIKEAIQEREMTLGLRDELLEQLEPVAVAFKVAVEAPGDAAFGRVVSELNMLLSALPSKLDSSISDAARELNLDRLVELMTKVRAMLPVAPTAHDARIELFLKGADALNRLRDELSWRVKEHSQLQRLDSKLRTVCVAGTIPGAVGSEWGRIKLVRSKLVPPFSTELETENEQLVAIESEIDAAMERGQEQVALDLLNKEYFDSVSTVFRNVDSNLKEFCMRLSDASQPLETILSMF